MTDMEYIKARADSLTEFVPTKMDLELLADALADDLIGWDAEMRTVSGRSITNWYFYLQFRLGRILDFLPELESKITEKVKRGFEENDARYKQYEADMNKASEKADQSENTAPF